MTQQVSLREVIAPSFYEVHQAVKACTYTHYWLNGGRGSTKSSFAAAEIILGMMRNPALNAVVLRQVADTLRDSVYEQLQWAIEKLGVSHLWHAGLVPLRLTYRPTGQRIVFKGNDDPKKIKSIKFSRGALGYVWLEELAEFKSMEAVRTVLQSLVRGTDAPTIFYTYNPPASAASWVNAEAVAQAQRPDVLVHSSDYTTVPPEWLGPQFIAEAEHLRKINPKKYAHEYLGEQTGTGGEVFTNINPRRVSDKQIAMMDKVMIGLDFGFAADPTAVVWCYFNKAKSRLVIYDEIYQVQLRTDDMAEKIKAKNPENLPVIADAAEPRSIDDLNRRGLRVHRAKKGPGSVEHGVRWLADLAEIIIDPVRCPRTLNEFTGYEVPRDAQGYLKGVYADKNNHSIDAARYATERIRKAWVI